MKIMLTDTALIDGLEFGNGSRLDLDPVFAMALIERKKAVPDREDPETPERANVTHEKAVKHKSGKKT